ncbi:MAG: RidA family protein [Candidatus Dormibacteraeota bacterium]|nr:RidA family protein [Candidatus Dormibacteraeota bacterium]
MGDDEGRSPEERLAELGVTLEMGHPVVANYAKAVRTGSLVFVSGHGPFVDGKAAFTGKLGEDVTVESGRQAARTVIVSLLGTLKAELGELSRISRWVKLLVLVNATPDFAEHHLVADGATDLLVEGFGEIGRPARSAIGMASLPFNFSVEVEAVVEIQD